VREKRAERAEKQRLAKRRTLSLRKGELGTYARACSVSCSALINTRSFIYIFIFMINF